MIVMGHSLCLPSPATVQELFSVARDANVIPDISLDPVLTTFLSLDSSAALQHQYAFLQRSMSMEQQAKFSQSLTQELGVSSKVIYGGVGVVALALSVLFDQVAQQVRAQGSTARNQSTEKFEAKGIFGIRSSSRIGSIICSYLGLIPGIANNEDMMAETTELYDNWLKFELIDHYERMTTKKRMSSVSMQQWLTGAAVHLHMRIHQVRLHSVPVGSAESLRLSYKTGLSRLVRGYTTYLHRNIKETAASGPQKTQTWTARQSKKSYTSTMSNTSCSNKKLFNVRQVNTSASTDTFNKTTAPNSAADIIRECKTRGSREELGVRVSKGSNATTVSVGTRKMITNLTEYSSDGEPGKLGLLVIEPLRNVSHSVQHHPCQSPAIQQALVTRIINTQDLESNRNIFIYSDKDFHNLLRQKNDFDLITITAP